MTPRNGIKKGHRSSPSSFHSRNHSRRLLLRRPTSPPSGSQPPVAAVPDPAPAPNLPDCTVLSEFPFAQDSIDQYRSVVPRHASYMDCFINALQLLRLFDERTANIMRVSSAGVSGFTHEQIVSIFILFSGLHYEFKLLSIDDFWRMLNRLTRGHAVLAGVKTTLWGIGHVFLIRKTADDRLEYLDPQIYTVCDLSHPTAECSAVLNQPLHYMLFQSTVKLSPDQLRHWGFVLA